MSYEREILGNGLKIVTENVPYVRSVSIGFWVGTGVKDDPKEYSGMSHFIEHLLFKGTQHRNAFQIAEPIESVGGQINAFTHKEYTCFYAKVPEAHLNIAIDILADMLLYPLLDSGHIQLEKKVIAEEIRRHEDAPDEKVIDLFEETIWKDHPLGNKALGDYKCIEGIKRAQILSHLEKFYTPDNLIIGAVGNLSHAEFSEALSKIFNSVTGKKVELTENAPQPTSNFNLLVKDTEQVHLCLGAPGFAQADDNKFALYILNALLGEGMSSRLFQEVRERRGLVYSINSGVSSFRNTGVFAIYAGTSSGNVRQVVRLINKELRRVKQERLSPEELAKAKERLKGELLLSLESTSARMLRIALSEFYFNHITSIDEIVDKIEKVTEEDVLRVARSIFDEGVLNLAIVGPLEEKLKDTIYEDLWG